MHAKYKDYYTFIMLKPDALEREIVYRCLEYLNNDLSIINVSCRKVNSELIKKHYKDVIDKQGDGFLEKLEAYLNGKYVIPMVLKSTRPDIIEYVRQIVGSTNPAEANKGTIRGDLGLDSYKKSDEVKIYENIIHASDSPVSVRKEIALWFDEKLSKNLLSDEWFENVQKYGKFKRN